MLVPAASFLFCFFGSPRRRSFSALFPAAVVSLLGLNCFRFWLGLWVVLGSCVRFSLLVWVDGFECVCRVCLCYFVVICSYLVFLFSLMARRCVRF